MNPSFWKQKRVLVTGHTGFKGAWLSLLLHRLGSQVFGLAIDPPTVPNLFDQAGLDDLLDDARVDVRDLDAVCKRVQGVNPDIVIHMAAQPLVLQSYENPVKTYATNVMGTVHVLEAIRQHSQTRVLVNVTTDKCYENQEWAWGYRENDSLGGHDPYSNSKGCSEMVTAAYRKSFFNKSAGTFVATARAGNVIGGGDWADNRLIPDCIRSFTMGKSVPVRHPQAIRPWQFVLEPLGGYLLLAERLYESGTNYAQAWNFGPDEEAAQSVQWIVDRLVTAWADGATWHHENSTPLHEAHYLKLDCSKAKSELHWQPRMTLAQALDWTVDWFKNYTAGQSARSLVLDQIDQYLALSS